MPSVTDPSLGRALDRLTSRTDQPGPDDVFGAFVDWTAEQGITLYPAQEEALIEVVSGANVILGTPTGSGKSLVALGAHVSALAAGGRTFYTAPIKALVSEKFFALCDVLGPERVGMLTGDASVNAEARLVCCTAEVLANIALREEASPTSPRSSWTSSTSTPSRSGAGRGRSRCWSSARAQFLLMSATLGDTARFEEDLVRRTGRPTVTIASGERPVPLFYSWAMTPLHETVTELLDTHRAPVYVVHFTQAAALERAQSLLSVPVASREQRDQIATHIAGFRFSPGFGRTLNRLVRHGIGVHHAGMLPKYRRLVEQLAQRGLLQVVCGTDTLGVGINVPIRTVLFTGLTKFDGSRQRSLKAREFHQIAGRAGRAGYDTAGYVVVQAPEHTIENARNLAKAGDDPKKLRKVQRKKPPDGFVTWSEESFERLVAAPPEPLVSRMRVTHAMVLNVMARQGDPFAAMRKLLRDNHEDPRRQVRHVRQAVQIYRSLLAAGVVERLDRPDADGRVSRLVEDLQLGFALNQPLSAFALGAVDVLDPAAPAYPLDVVSVVEATLEDPRAVLLAQQFKARGEAVAEMKADGLEYDERMELLDDVTWPKPLAELLSALLATYRQTHPWVAEEALSPKSVVREMWERAMTFSEYVGWLGLGRSEGLLLRYLSDAYRTLRQTVPDSARTEGLDDIVEWLGAVVRQTDSSLVDEWEALVSGAPVAAEPTPGGVPGVRSVTADARGFRVMVRNAMFRRVDLLARRRWEDLAALDSGLTAEQWRAAGRRTRTSTATSESVRMPEGRRCSSSATPGRAGCRPSRSSTTPRASTTGGSVPWSISRRPTTRVSRSSPRWHWLRSADERVANLKNPGRW